MAAALEDAHEEIVYGRLVASAAVWVAFRTRQCPLEMTAQEHVNLLGIFAPAAEERADIVREALLGIHTSHGNSFASHTAATYAAVAVAIVSNGICGIHACCEQTYSPSAPALLPKLLPTTPVQVHFFPSAFVQEAVASAPTSRHFTFRGCRGVAAASASSARPVKEVSGDIVVEGRCGERKSFFLMQRVVRRCNIESLLN